MDFDAILQHVPVDDIAQRFGVSQDEARRAVREGGAVLLGGLSKNAQTEEGSSAIEKALSRHEGFSGASRVDDVDTADGEKILGHVLGGKRKEVEEKLTKSDKTAGGIDFGKLLPILAPIIMGILANAKKGPSSGSASSGGGLGDIIGGLGGLFGGGQQAGGGGIGDIIGGLFGRK